MALWEAEVGGSPEVKTSLANMMKPLLYKKYEKKPAVVAHAYNLSYSGGRGRRIPWTQEVEVAVLHSSLSDRSETLSQGEKKGSSGRPLSFKKECVKREEKK